MSQLAPVQAPPQAAALEAVHSLIGNYYSAKVRQFGPTPWGVDWACMPSQELRFVQLLKLCAPDGDFSINDVGCGYGALLGFLDRRFKGRFDYVGVDISPDMVREARKLWARHPHAFFSSIDMPPRRADYSVASGIFNVEVHGLTPTPLPGVANLGIRPSLDPNDVNGGRVLLETHCLDWPASIGPEGGYGKIIRVDLLHKLHDELKYDSLEALTVGIAKDCDDAREFFAKRSV